MTEQFLQRLEINHSTTKVGCERMAEAMPTDDLLSNTAVRASVIEGLSLAWLVVLMHRVRGAERAPASASAVFVRKSRRLIVRSDVMPFALSVLEPVHFWSDGISVPTSSRRLPEGAGRESLSWKQRSRCCGGRLRRDG